MIVADVADCYRKHSEALVRFAASQVGWSDADDVVAAAVLGVLGQARDGEHQASTGEDVSDLRGYLYRSVANAAARHWRTLDRRRRREDRAFTVAPSAWGDAEPGEREVALLSALARLSVQQRAVVHLTYWEDLTPAAVAARLAVSEGTVRRQLARARARLRSVIE